MGQTKQHGIGLFSLAFSIRLRQARYEANMTQKELGEKTGISPATISFYEKSPPEKPAKPSLENPASLARALGVPLDWLCDYEPKTSSQEKPEKEVLKNIVAITNYFGDRCSLDVTMDKETKQLAGVIEFLGGSVYSFINTLKTFMDYHKKGEIDDKILEARVKDAVEQYSRMMQAENINVPLRQE